jgi:hypothetical protein
MLLQRRRLFICCHQDFSYVAAEEGTAPAAVAAEEAEAAGAQEEAPAEGGLVDIASILGAPAVTIVRSSL